MTPDDLNPALGPDDSVMIAAFEGWNDAGGAASTALDHLATTWDATVHATLDPEDYHDFQVSRPSIVRDANGERVMSWPGTIISTTSIEGSPAVSIVRGIEPSMRWRTFCKEILDHAENLGVSTLVTCGALLVDVPHTRPRPTFVTSEQESARARFGLEASDYEGPTGIVGVLGHEAEQRGITVLSVWVGVPHYIAHPPSPKATAALLVQLERLLDTTIDLGDLPDEADAWVRGADELAQEDEEIAEHVQQLEALMDETSLPEASGDAIAAEFERFLRRRDGGGPKNFE
ncbi:PAC2 family protein [Demequina sp. B12]|uniref:PAC2 family protein n=1 Tax=Demequina sp. B12 TaxID=2992757 RepID=UPI00237C0A1A|nr:PAC2 family protein [Demequina sp. B12]MDE0573206.1 PAC2 family protein [Demequina sp. B12]